MGLIQEFFFVLLFEPLFFYNRILSVRLVSAPSWIHQTLITTQTVNRSLQPDKCPQIAM